MKRMIASLLAAVLALSLCACGQKVEPSAQPEPETEGKTVATADYLAAQASADDALLAEGEANYPFEEPLVVLNPYGNAPLCAVAVFTTDESLGGEITVRGKAPEDDLHGTFDAATVHYVPVYGLYAGDTTQVVLRLSDGRETTFEVTTEPIALNYYGDYAAQSFDAALYDGSKLNFCGFIFEACFAAFDSKGDMRWFLSRSGSCGMKLLDNGHLLVPTGQGFGAAGQTGIREIDFMGKVYHEYVWNGGQHHDFDVLPNGNYIVLADTPNGSTNQDYIVEIDPSSGNVVWELAVADLVDRHDGGGFGSEEADWSHQNALCYDEKTDTLIVSCRNQDGIFGIRKATKELLWILGDPSGWEKVDSSKFFTPVGDDFAWQYGAHGVNLLPDGTLLLFDNGYGGRVKAPELANAIPDDENYSRAARYRIDPEAMTVEQVWSFGKELGNKYYASVISYAASLDEDGDDYLITYGSCNPSFGSEPYTSHPLTETNWKSYVQYVAGNQLIWEMELRGGVYRTYRLDPYVSSYTPGVKGEWHGNLGVTEPLADAFELTDAQPLSEKISVSLYPFNALFVNGTMILPDDGEAGQFAVVLLDADGKQYSYPMRYSGIQTGAGFMVVPKAWVSLNGLPQGTYSVYVILNGEVFVSDAVLPVTAS